MEINKIFFSPIGISKTNKSKEFFDSLEAVINKNMESSKGVQISNKGGWQSNKELFELDNQVILDFNSMIKNNFCEFLNQVYPNSNFKESDVSMEAWANVNYKGNSNNSHDHTVNDNHWSGVFYLNPGESIEAKRSGFTIFEDRNLSGDGRMIGTIPRPQGSQNPPISEFSSTPELGKMVFFPGSLWHRVSEYKGDSRRITIAYNFRVKGLENHVFDQESGSSKFMSFMWIYFRGIMVLGSRIKRMFF